MTILFLEVLLLTIENKDLYMAQQVLIFYSKFWIHPLLQKIEIQNDIHQNNSQN